MYLQRQRETCRYDLPLPTSSLLLHLPKRINKLSPYYSPIQLVFLPIIQQCQPLPFPLINTLASSSIDSLPRFFRSILPKYDVGRNGEIPVIIIHFPFPHSWLIPSTMRPLRGRRRQFPIPNPYIHHSLTPKCRPPFNRHLEF